MPLLIEFVETTRQMFARANQSRAFREFQPAGSGCSFFTGRNYPSKRLLDTTGVWKFSENRRSNSVNGRKRGTEKAAGARGERETVVGDEAREGLQTDHRDCNFNANLT